MKPAGIAAYSKRKEERSAIYAFETEQKELLPAYTKLFKANKKAWAYFEAQAPWYRKVSLHRVMSAKQEKTQLSRLQKLIDYCQRGERVPG
ncbi:MAG: YdeI/OmpD-associated family protein [Mucilaginibacter sp.]|nr:YdeI/OmpD-associated family protein [Mucilaginibacter sp.]